jgi:DNA-binding NarL/FixJ family response regulator
VYRKIRVLVVDDEYIVSEAIAALLEMDAGITVVGHAASAEMCLWKTRSLRPDVVLLDLHLPDKPGVEVIHTLLAENPNLPILILTGYAEDHEVAAALRAGVVGYVLKTQSVSELVGAIKNAQQGRSSIPPQVAKIMLKMLQSPQVAPAATEGLSEAEQRILTYVAQGWDNKTIARQLRLAQCTVQVHVSHILSKLHLENRTQAALYAVKHGYVSLAGQRQTVPIPLSYGYAGLNRGRAEVSKAA